ncbi:putative tail length tape measure protein [Devosia sp. H5989]|nr:putative tail length tape measure protein [Devosia sp. H5989]
MMATTDVERLVVSLEASVTKFERAMSRASGQADQTARKIETRFTRMKAVTSNALGNVFALAGAGLSLRAAQQVIDASTRIENSLKATGLAGEDLTKVYDALFRSAQRNAAPLEALTTLFGRASLVQNELGVSTEDLLNFTDKIGVALRVSGTSAQEASGALLQLSQLLGSGTVRAEEFNSVQEGALPILQAVANGLTEAGGSVATLRKLVIDGKLSSEAFFRAFDAGSSILEDKVANAEMTVSQGFVRLQNVLIDTAGKFDAATGASRIAGNELNNLAGIIEAFGNLLDQNKGPIGDFSNAIEYLFSEKAGRDFRKALGLDAIDDFLDGTSLIEGKVGFLSQQTDEAAASITKASDALLDFAAGAQGVFAPETEDAFNDLIAHLIDGTVNAAEAKKAITALGDADPKFDIVVGELNGLIAVFDNVTQAAARAKAASEFRDIGSFPTQSEFNDTLGIAPKKVSIADYPTTPGSKKGKTAGQKFQDSLDEQQRRIDNLREETALQATLNPLLNDYDQRLTELKTRQELLNAAEKAGIDITPEMRARIYDLALGYANATVEAEKLAEAQDNARQQMEDWFSTSKDITRGFIDDLIEGKSAAEALGNAFQQLGGKLLDLGLSSLFGTGSGANPFGLLGQAFGIPGRAAGGAVQAGQPYIVGEKRPELFVPNQSGTIVPRVPTMASVPSMPGGPSGDVNISYVIDARGVDASVVGRLRTELEQHKQMLVPTVRNEIMRRQKWGGK